MNIDEADECVVLYHQKLREMAPHEEWMPDLSKRPHGCGSYGCVYRTHAPGIVFKVTADSAEFRMVQKIQTLHSQPDGFVRYYACTEMGADPYKIMNVYGIWREEVSEMGEFETTKEAIDSIDAIDAVGITIGNILRRNKDKLRIVLDAQDHIKEWIGKKFDAYVPGYPMYSLDISIRLAICLRFYELLCRKMTNLQPTRLMGRTLLDLYERNILLLDVRYANVGVVNRRGEKFLIIADPSHAEFLHE